MCIKKQRVAPVVPASCSSKGFQFLVVSSARSIVQFCGLVIFPALLGAMMLSGNARGAPCSTSAATLSVAKNTFAQLCPSQRRADCDSIGGVWYCSSERINNAIPDGLAGSNSSTGNNSQSNNQSGNSVGTTCSVVANNLSAAQSGYAQQCSTAPRKDCDEINGKWYCSSQQIGKSIPAGLVNSASVSNTGGGNTTGNTTTAGNTSTAGGTSSASSAGSGPCIDPDGDGWGWNGASCKVTKTAGGAGTAGNTTTTATPSTASASANAAGSGSCIDPDGDGWGWNGASCKVAATAGGNSTAAASQSQSKNQFVSSSITDLVLLTGQSNALGANTGFNAALDTAHDRVFAFTDKGWVRADLHQIWDRGWHPRNHPDTDPSNNLLLHFGKRLAALDAERVVGFILVSAPGAPISNWDYNGAFYKTVRRRVLDAINQLPHKYQLDGILWHQGETDAVDSPVYGAKLNALIGNLRSESWFSAAKPFICGEIAKRGGVNNQLNKLNSNGDSSTACVSAAGVATKIDGAHFTAAGLREIGRRYGDKFYQMTR